MVLLTPALRALKHAYPESNLALLLRPLVTDLMETHPYVDTCIVDTKAGGRLKSLTSLIRRIRVEEFDVAVVLHPTSFRNALIPFLARVPIRVGTNIAGRGALLTTSIKDDTGVHEVHRYLRILRLLNIEDAADTLEFWHTDADRETIRDRLYAAGISATDRLVAINLGTTWHTKQWDIANFAEVIQQTVERIPNTRVVLTGSPAEKGLVSALPTSLPVINLVGETSILELGALLERCEICLTSDSGPMHIAAAVGTPTVALFGPTDPIRHKPYGTGHTVIEKSVGCRPCYKRTCYRKDTPHLCMTKIDTAEVVKALEENYIRNLSNTKITKRECK